VITEYPRYRPTGSSYNFDLKFEKKLFSLEEVLGSQKQVQPSKLAASGDVSIGVGALQEDVGRDGDNDLADCGREEIQKLTSTHALNGLDVETLSRESVDGMTPMDRFVFEVGAWSSYSRCHG
jgi:hypothetical protein